MNRYDSYKDSSVAWLGEVPSHWEVIPFKFLTKIIKGKIPKNIVGENANNLPPYLSMEYLRTGIATQFIADKNATIINENEILLLWDGSNAGEFVKSRKGVISSTIALINFKNTIHKNFVWYACSSVEIVLRATTTGMGIPHVNSEELKKSLIALPPLSEQTAIAQYLDNKTAKIDRAIELEQQQIELLKERKQIVIQTAVTRGLNPHVSLKDSGVEWLGEVPEHWEVKKLKYVLELSNKKEESRNSNKRYIGMENVESFTGSLNEVILTAEGISNSFFKDEILFGKLRPYLAKSYLAEFDGICSTEFLVYKASKEIYNRFALNIFLSYGFIDTVNSSTYGSKMPRANSEFIANILLAIPPLSEQTAIAQYLDEQTAKIDRAIGIKLAQIDKLKEYKTVLINEVVTGKRRVLN